MRYISRQQLLEGLGFLCKDPDCSWSYINEQEKQICFCVWVDHEVEPHTFLALSDTWQEEQIHPGYNQMIDHIGKFKDKRLGYEAYVLVQRAEDENERPRKIKELVFEQLFPATITEKISDTVHQIYAKVHFDSEPLTL